MQLNLSWWHDFCMLSKIQHVWKIVQQPEFWVDTHTVQALVTLNVMLDWMDGWMLEIFFVISSQFTVSLSIYWLTTWQLGIWCPLQIHSLRIWGQKISLEPFEVLFSLFPTDPVTLKWRALWYLRALIVHTARSKRACFSMMDDWVAPHSGCEGLVSAKPNASDQ